MEDFGLQFFCNNCSKGNAMGLESSICSLAHIRKKYKKGEYIAYQGDKVMHLLMLEKGRVKTEIVSNSGLTLPMEEIIAPYPLAAAFLFADKNRFPVDVIALEESEVLFVTKEAVERQISRCAGFMRGFLAFNANRMQYLSERLKIFAQKGIKAKLVYYIISHENDGEFDLGRSISSLSEYFGVERPSLSRVISEMVKDEIITYEQGKGKIINSKALEQYLV